MEFDISSIPWISIILGTYTLVGIFSFFWIKSDADFRAGPWVLIGLLTLFLWPIMNLIWILVRGEEHITEMAAKQTHRDFRKYMREKEDKDLFVNFDSQAEAAQKLQSEQMVNPDDLDSKRKPGEAYTDLNIERLMEEGQFDEALAAAEEMKKVAEASGETDRLGVYETYIHRIEDAKRMVGD